MDYYAGIVELALVGIAQAWAGEVKEKDDDTP